jgi:hypothetical protein
MSKKELLSCRQAAQILGFTPEHVRRLCGSGKIKAHKIIHTWVMYESDLKNITRQRKKKEI